MDDLDDIDTEVLTSETGACLLCYPCGCTVRIAARFVVDVNRCDDPDHQFIGNQVDP